MSGPELVDDLASLTTVVFPSLSLESSNNTDSILNSPIAPASMREEPLPHGYMGTRIMGQKPVKMVGAVGTTFRSDTLLDYHELVYTNNFDPLKDEFGKIQMSHITDELLHTTTIDSLAETNFIEGKGNLAYGPIADKSKVTMRGESPEKPGHIDFKIAMNGLKIGSDFVMMGQWDNRSSYNSDLFVMNAVWPSITTMAFPGKALDPQGNVVDVPTQASSVPVTLTPGVSILPGPLVSDFADFLKGYTPLEITDNLTPTLAGDLTSFTSVFFNMHDPQNEKKLRVSRQTNCESKGWSVRDRVLVGPSQASKTRTDDATLKYMLGVSELTIEKIVVTAGEIIVTLVLKDEDNAASVPIAPFATLFHDGGSGSAGSAGSEATLYVSGYAMTSNGAGSGLPDGTYKVDYNVAVSVGTAASPNTFGASGGNTAPTLTITLKDSSGNTLTDAASGTPAAAVTTEASNGTVNLSLNSIDGDNNNTHWSVPAASRTGTNPITLGTNVLTATNFTIADLPVQPVKTLFDHVSHAPKHTTTLTYETRDRSTELVMSSDELIVKTENLSDVVAVGGTVDSVAIKKMSLLYPVEGQTNIVDNDIKAWVEDPLNLAGPATTTSGLFGQSTGLENMVIKDFLVSFPVSATVTFTNRVSGLRESKAIGVWLEVMNCTATKTWYQYEHITGGKSAYNWNGASGTTAVGTTGVPGIVDIYLADPGPLVDAKTGNNVDNLPVEDSIVLNIAGGWMHGSSTTTGPGAGAPLVYNLKNKNFMSLEVNVNCKKAVNHAQMSYFTESGKEVKSALVDVAHFLNDTTSELSLANYGLVNNVNRLGLDTWFPVGPLRFTRHTWAPQLLDATIGNCGMALIQRPADVTMYIAAFINELMFDSTPLLTDAKKLLLQNAQIILTDTSKFAAVAAANGCIVLSTKVLPVSANSSTVVRDLSTNDLIAPTIKIQLGDAFRNSTGTDIITHSPKILSVTVLEGGFKGDGNILSTRIVIDNTTAMSWTDQGANVTISGLKTGYNDAANNGGLGGIDTTAFAHDTIGIFQWPRASAEIEFSSEKIMVTTPASKTAGTLNFGLITGTADQTIASYGNVIGNNNRIKWAPITGGYTIFSENILETNFTELGNPTVIESAAEIVGTPLLSIEAVQIQVAPQGLEQKLTKSLISILENRASPTFRGIIESMMPSVSINRSQGENGSGTNEPVKSGLAPAASPMTQTELDAILKKPQEAGAYFENLKVKDRRTGGVAECRMSIIVVGTFTNGDSTDYGRIKSHDVDNVTITTVNISSTDVQLLQSVGYTPVPKAGATTTCEVVIKVDVVDSYGEFSQPGDGHSLEINFDDKVPRGYFNTKACLRLTTDSIKLNSTEGIVETLFNNIRKSANGQALLKSFLKLDNETTLILDTYNNSNKILTHAKPMIMLEVTNYLNESQADEIAEDSDPFLKLEELTQSDKTPAAVPVLFYVKMSFIPDADGQVMFGGPKSASLYTNFTMVNLESTVQISSKDVWTPSGIVYANEILASDGLFEQFEILVEENLISPPQQYAGSELDTNEDLPLPIVIPNSLDFKLQVTPELKEKVKVEIIKSGYGYNLDDSLYLPPGQLWVAGSLALKKMVTSTADATKEVLVEDEIAYKIASYFKTTAASISSLDSVSDALALTGQYLVDISVTNAYTATNFAFQFTADVTAATVAHTYDVVISGIEIVTTQKGTFGDKKLSSTPGNDVHLRREAFIKIGASEVDSKFALRGGTSVILGTVQTLTHTSNSVEMWLGEPARENDNGKPNKNYSLQPAFFGAPSAVNTVEDTLDIQQGDVLNIKLKSSLPELLPAIRETLTVTHDMLSPGSSNEFSENAATIEEQVKDIFDVLLTLSTPDELKELKFAIQSLFIEAVGYDSVADDFVRQSGEIYFIKIIAHILDSEKICDLAESEFKHIDGEMKKITYFFKETNTRRLLKMITIFILNHFILSDIDELLVKDVRLHEELNDLSSLTDEILEKPLTDLESFAQIITYRAEFREKSMLEAIIERASTSPLVQRLIAHHKQHLIVNLVHVAEDYLSTMLGSINLLDSKPERHASTLERGPNLLAKYDPIGHGLLLKNDNASMLAFALKDYQSMSSLEQRHLAMTLGCSVAKLATFTFIDIHNLLKRKTIDIDFTPILEVCYNDIQAGYVSLKRIIHLKKAEDYIEDEDAVDWIKDNVSSKVSHVLTGLTEEFILATIKEKFSLAEDVVLSFENVSLKLKFIKATVNKQPVALWRKFESDIVLTKDIQGPVAIASSAIDSIEGEETTIGNLGGYSSYKIPFASNISVSRSKLDGKILELSFTLFRTYAESVTFKKRIVFDPFVELPVDDIFMGYLDDTTIRVNPNSLANAANSLVFTADMNFTTRLEQTMVQFCEQETNRLIKSTCTLKANTDVVPGHVALICQSPVARSILSKTSDQSDLEMKDAPDLMTLLNTDGLVPTNRHLIYGTPNPRDHLNFTLVAFSNPESETSYKRAKQHAFVYQINSPHGNGESDYLLISETQGTLSDSDKRLAVFKNSVGDIVPLRAGEENYLHTTLTISIDDLATLVEGDNPAEYTVFRRTTPDAPSRTRETLTGAQYKAIYRNFNTIMDAGSKGSVEPTALNNIKAVAKGSVDGVYLAFEAATGTSDVSIQMQSVVATGVDHNALDELDTIASMVTSVVSSSFKTGENQTENVHSPTATLTIVVSYHESVFDDLEGIMVQSNAETTLLNNPLAAFNYWYVSLEVSAYFVNGVLQDAASLPEGAELTVLSLNLRGIDNNIVRSVPMKISEINIIEVGERLVEEGLEGIDLERNTLSARVKIKDINSAIIVAILIDLERNEPEVAASISLSNTLDQENLRDTIYAGIPTEDDSTQLALGQFEAYANVTSTFTYKKSIPVFLSETETYEVRFSKEEITGVSNSVRITSPPTYVAVGDQLKLTNRPQSTSFAERQPLSQNGSLYLEGPKLSPGSPLADLVYVTVLLEDPVNGVYQHDTEPTSGNHLQAPDGSAKLMDKVFFNRYPGDAENSASTLTNILNSTEKITLTSASGEVDEVNTLDDIMTVVVNRLFAGGSQMTRDIINLTEIDNALQASYGEVLQLGDVENFLQLEIPQGMNVPLKVTVTAVNFVATDETNQAFLVVPSDPLSSTSAQAIFNTSPLNDPNGLTHPALPSDFMGKQHALEIDPTDNKAKYTVPFDRTSMMTPAVMDLMDPFLAIMISHIGTIDRAVASFPSLEAIMNDEEVSQPIKEEKNLSYKFLKNYIDAVEAEKTLQGVEFLTDNEKITIWNTSKKLFILEEIIDVVPTAILKKTTAHKTLDLAVSATEFGLVATEHTDHILIQQQTNDTVTRLGSFTPVEYIKQGTSVEYPLIETSGVIIDIALTVKIKQTLTGRLFMGTNEFHLGDLADTEIGLFGLKCMNILKSDVDFACEYAEGDFFQEKITMGETSLALLLGLTCTRGTSTITFQPFIDRIIEEVVSTHLTPVDYAGVTQMNLLSPQLKLYDPNDPLAGPPQIAEDDESTHVERKRTIRNLFEAIEDTGAFSIGLENGDQEAGVFASGPITNETLKLNETFAISGQIPDTKTIDDLSTKLTSYHVQKLLTFDNMSDSGTSTISCSYGIGGTLATLEGKTEAELENDICMHSQNSYLQCMGAGVPVCGSMAYFNVGKGFRDLSKRERLSLGAMHSSVKLGATTLLKTNIEQQAYLDAVETAYLAANPGATPEAVTQAREDSKTSEEYIYNKDSMLNTQLTNISGVANNELGWSTTATSAEGVPKLYQSADLLFWNSNKANNFYDLILNLSIFDGNGETVDAVKRELNPNTNNYEITGQSFYKNSTVSKIIAAGSVLFADPARSYGFTSNSNMDYTVLPSHGFYLTQALRSSTRVASHLDIQVGPVSIPGVNAVGEFEQCRFVFPRGEVKHHAINPIAFGIAKLVDSGQEQPKFITKTSGEGESVTRDTFLVLNFQNASDIADRTSTLSTVVAKQFDGDTSSPVYAVFSTDLQNGEAVNNAGKFKRGTEKISIKLSGEQSDKLVGEDLETIFVDSLNLANDAFLPKPDDHVGEYVDKMSAIIFGTHSSSGLQSAIAPAGLTVNPTVSIKHSLTIPSIANLAAGELPLLGFQNATSTATPLPLV
jgi:hypothetical protein